MDWAVWGPPIVVLGLGAAGGVVFALIGGRSWSHDQGLADLEVRREVLMNRLRDLEADKHKLDDHDYYATRQRLVEQAAAVLRRMEEGPSESTVSMAPDNGGSRHLGWYLAGLAIFFAVAGLVLQAALAPRVDQSSVTGNAQSLVDDPVAEARAAFEADPTDIDALNQLTKWALYTQDLDTAMALIDKGKALDPQDPGVVVHLGALRALIGRHDEALADLESQEEALPAEVALWRGIIAMQLGDAVEARAQLSTAVKVADDPLDREFAAFLLGDAVAPAPGPTPDTGTSEQSPAIFTATVTATGEVEPGGVLYVYVRSSPVPAGQPAAARRIPDWELPLETTLGLDDLTAGGPFPDPAYVQAKLVRSGDPLQPSEGDLVSGVIGPVSGGTVTLELR
ncbi:MAG TPA: hypothetical protein QGF58_20795 [Myxococcota bacterium]|nr:hypothetical protein [Myxococcota bacterium]